MHSIAMGLRRARLLSAGQDAGRISAEFVPVAALRRLRKCEEVAAVCYRVGRKGIEFLLVKTRGSGHWTFPKGGVEAGLTHAQAAALEAFEEAGVHGRMEESAFANYVRRDARGNKALTSAHLCQVLRLGSPEESKRDPSWFSSDKTKRRLRQNRSPRFAAELARVVDLAVERIGQASRAHAPHAAELRRVRFEAFEGEVGWGRARRMPVPRDLDRAYESDQRPTIKMALHAHVSKVLQFVPTHANQNTPLLLEGEGEMVQGARMAPRLSPLADATDNDGPGVPANHVTESRRHHGSPRRRKTSTPRSKK